MGPQRQRRPRELEAVDFLQKLNTAVFAAHPDVLMVAEESTAWPKVTHPVDQGGLGFNFKWNMGWMNDICHYIKMDPYFRQFNHKDVTFSLMYAFSENYILPLSHDEVVHMKGSFFGKMPGEDPQKFAGVRAFYAYMMTHPGKKLTFMGAEFAQWNEWHYEYSLDWHLLQYRPHRQTQDFFKAMNAFYLQQPALWQQDDSWHGFQWLCADDNTANTVSFLRWDKDGKPLLVVCNFSPNHRNGYRVGAPFAGTWTPVFNTDDTQFGGQGWETRPREDGEGPLPRPGPVPGHRPAPHVRHDLPLLPQIPGAQARRPQGRAGRGQKGRPQKACRQGQSSRPRPGDGPPGRPAGEARPAGAPQEGAPAGPAEKGGEAGPPGKGKADALPPKAGADRPAQKGGQGRPLRCRPSPKR
ncbi:MAG: alpha amylase C-terminal domain-containing protein [Lawsonibacter sp.]